MEDILLLNESVPLAQRAQLLNDRIAEVTRHNSVECDEVTRLRLRISALPDSPFTQWTHALFQALDYKQNYYEKFMVRVNLWKYIKHILLYLVFPKF